MNLSRSLHHRPFALLWTGQTISRLGDSLYRIALAWWVLEKTGSAEAMGTVLIFSSVPLLIFSLIGGVAVDRFPRTRVMLVSDLLRGLLIGVVSLLALTDRLEVWHIYVLSMLFGIVVAFFYPAYTAVVPEITPPDVLTSANSLTALSSQFTGIIGPALGATVVALGGTPIAFALDGISFFISAACLVPLLRLSSSLVPAAPRTGVVVELAEGMRAVLASPWLWITIAVFGLVNVTDASPTSISLPFLIKQDLHSDVGALGLVQSMLSIGSVVGALWLGRTVRLRRRGLLAYGATIVSGLMTLTMGLIPSVAAVSGAALIRGAALATFSLIWTNTLQELVPRQMLGRVSSIDSLGSWVLLPVGYGLAGWATDRFGAPFVFVAGGAGTMLLAALSLLHPAIRNLD